MRVQQRIQFFPGESYGGFAGCQQVAKFTQHDPDLFDCRFDLRHSIRHAWIGLVRTVNGQQQTQNVVKTIVDLFVVVTVGMYPTLVPECDDPPGVFFGIFAQIAKERVPVL